VLPAVIFLVKV